MSEHAKAPLLPRDECDAARTAERSLSLREAVDVLALGLLALRPAHPRARMLPWSNANGANRGLFSLTRLRPPDHTFERRGATDGLAATVDMHTDIRVCYATLVRRSST